MSRTKGEPPSRSGFEAQVAAWDTDELLKAVATEGELFSDYEVSSIDNELRRRRVTVPLKCSVCALINPLRTSECPACGHKHSEVTAEISAAGEEQRCSRCHQVNDEGTSECAHCGHALDSALQKTKVRQDNEREIDASARQALKGSVMCFLFPGFSLFLAPFVMSRAIDTLGALSELRKEPADRAFVTSARSKAIIALLVGALVFLFNVILVIYFMSSILQSRGLREF